MVSSVSSQYKFVYQFMFMVLKCIKFINVVIKLTIQDKMSGLKLIEPIDLYNLLNQESVHPSLSDPVFMLLLGEVLLESLVSMTWSQNVGKYTDFASTI
jgi:hypothetical protein